MKRHGVVIPEAWTPTGPFEALAPLPLDEVLVWALYEEMGLPVLQVSLFLGTEHEAVRSALRAAGVELRAPESLHSGGRG